MTTNSKSAGMESNAILQLKNDSTSSGHIFLENSGTSFVQGATDVFDELGLVVHNPTYLEVWHDGHGPGSSWQPDVVIVENMKSGEVSSE